MTDNPGTNPDPANPPGQQLPPDPASTPPETPPTTPTPPAGTAPEGYVEMKRFSGAITKIETLTLENRGLQEQLTAKTSEIERLNTQLANKDIETTVAVGERDKNLEIQLQKSIDMEKELAELRAFKLKVDTAKELGHPELVSILDSIPSIVDPEVLKGVMSDFVGFREAGIKEREQVLLGGYIPPTPPVPIVETTPQSDKEWEAHVNSLPLGSKERQKAFDDWFDWKKEQG